MTPRHLLTTLLILAWIAVDAALLNHLRQPPTGQFAWSAVLSLGVVFGQSAIAAVWMVTPPRSVVKLIAALAWLYAGSFLAAHATDGPKSVHKWFLLLALNTLCVAVAWVLVRLVRARSSARPGARTGQRRLPQFGLSGLFACTTTVAVLLGTAQHFEVPGKHMLYVLGFCLLMTLTSLAAITALTGRLSPATTILVVLACLLVAACLPWTGIPPLGRPALMLLVTIQTLSIAASLAVLLIAGHPVHDPQ